MLKSNHKTLSSMLLLGHTVITSSGIGSITAPAQSHFNISQLLPERQSAIFC